MPRLATLSKAAALACLAAIVVLSLVPGSERPHTGFSDFWENFAAYFICAALLAAKAPRWGRVMRIAAALCACSVILETLQNFIPGRVPDPADVVSNGLGALAGAVVATAIATALKPRA